MELGAGDPRPGADWPPARDVRGPGLAAQVGGVDEGGESSAIPRVVVRTAQAQLGQLPAAAEGKMKRRRRREGRRKQERKEGGRHAAVESLCPRGREGGRTERE